MEEKPIFRQVGQESVNTTALTTVALHGATGPLSGSAVLRDEDKR
jgi:hypothetical protein